MALQKKTINGISLVLVAAMIAWLLASGPSSSNGDESEALQLATKPLNTRDTQSAKVVRKQEVVPEQDAVEKKGSPEHKMVIRCVTVDDEPVSGVHIRAISLSMSKKIIRLEGASGADGICTIPAYAGDYQLNLSADGMVAQSGTKLAYAGVRVPGPRLTVKLLKICATVVRFTGDKVACYEASALNMETGSAASAYSIVREKLREKYPDHFIFIASEGAMKHGVSLKLYTMTRGSMSFQLPLHPIDALKVKVLHIKPGDGIKVGWITVNYRQPSGSVIQLEGRYSNVIRARGDEWISSFKSGERKMLPPGNYRINVTFPASTSKLAHAIDAQVTVGGDVAYDLQARTQVRKCRIAGKKGTVLLMEHDTLGTFRFPILPVDILLPMGRIRVKDYWKADKSQIWDIKAQPENEVLRLSLGG